MSKSKISIENSENFIQPPAYSTDPSPSSNIVLPSPSTHDDRSHSQSHKLKSNPADSSALDIAAQPQDIIEAQPPEFSLYRASYTTDSLGNITSHDPHLNSDGEALCRFILLHISAPPSLFVKLSGSHEEVRLETTSESVNGRTEYQTREQRQTVTDFSFSIQIPSEHALDHNIRRLYVVSDGQVVGRGGHWRERGRWENGRDLKMLQEANGTWTSQLPSRQTAKVNCKERRRSDKINQQTASHGYPPFIPPWWFPNHMFSTEPTRPPDELLGPNWQYERSKTFDSLFKQGYYLHRPSDQRDLVRTETELRQWCDDYCNSKKHLKQFTVQKIIFGWDLAMLENELLKWLRELPHLRATHFSVEFHHTSSKIVVRPVNSLSKLFSLSGFYKFMLTITLIYPIIWLIRYLVLGVEYDVVRVAYPLVYWQTNNEHDQLDRSAASKLVLKGQTERNWFLANQARIAQACRDRKMGVL
ncbi:hypothetical protein O181_023478 [Austropuccinia psidii MF-1]|uniref:Uncharacterized protein n=1 Tax=Austropuccinia psidii MF-1 TaxID=1389203 RepID=A0A9Q3CIV7_9BASI|nr:hypothetical protein [Austropuccinia psidii MF-1]